MLLPNGRSRDWGKRVLVLLELGLELMVLLVILTILALVLAGLLMVLLLLIVLYPYTAKRRDVLGNISPEDQKISQEPRGAKSPPISRAFGGSGNGFPNTFLLSAVYESDTS